MVLKHGSKGEDVRKIQLKLGLSADGDFGPNIEAKVKAWQAANGMLPNGVVDDAMWNKLFGAVTAESAQAITGALQMKTVFKQSPHISAKAIVPKGIVLHHTAGSYVGSVAWCLDPKSKVSYHCIVDLNGDKTILAKDNQRAWHAGESYFKGQSKCNDFLLGIAVSGDTSKRELTEEEIESVAYWCLDKMALWNISIDWVTTHREISPGRKNDVDTRAEKKIKEKILQYI
jgi:N-acetyl-anhydromuramoyl-L-alanine amidase